ncbi:hypothetical protein BDW59DRAFT_167821 [Aspergillus cavernicola]|uniref:Calcium-transporting ATPase n=1 Tax=Aspergillus cavernicola TaxID=176166 RepID=A0ABR4HCB8_9EURO
MAESTVHSNYLSVPGARSRGNSLESEESNGGELHSNGSNGSPLESANFAFSPGQLNKLLNPKSLGAFYAFGGLGGLEKGLRTDVRSGLSLDETELNGTVRFDDATAPSSAPKPLTETSPTTPAREDTTPPKQDENAVSSNWLAYNGKMLILLTVAAVISLALGIYQSITADPGEPRVQWVEGVAIIVAILIVVVVGAANDWQKERQFVKLNKKKEDTTRMLKDHNLVRLLRTCETMGNATTICSDKTGTLTENKMTAVAATLGNGSRFGGKSQASSPAPGNEGRAADSGNILSPSEFASSLSHPAKQLLVDSIVLNSTAFEAEQEGAMTFIGSKTETALLGFAWTYLGLGSLGEARDNANIVQMVPFDSGRKCMAAVIKIDNGKKYRMLVKGAIVRDPTQNLDERPLEEKDRSTLDGIINHYATQSLRTIGLIYRDFTEWPPRGAPTQEEDRSLASFDHIFKDMIMFGVFGIQDPLRVGVTESVQQCQRAGVFVRMVTGDNIVTAKAIAQECGIFTPGGLAIEGPKFRKLSSRQMTQIIPRLQVLARSSPDDKKILVTHLKKLGETVAVTGDGTNDAQALKTADVGFSMGITGTEVAKEASDIILMDDNFASIVKAMAWGRTVNDAVKKFLQFQITVNITAVLLTFISAVASGDEESVLTAVQLLWVNLIMDTFAALALATDPPSPYVLNRRPEPKSAPLINLTMWKMIIGQSIYQLVVTLIRSTLKSLIDFSGDENADTVLSTVVFNTFVWMQIFNQWNSRRLDSGFNIFERLLRNRWFIGIQFIIVGGQILIVFVGGHALSVARLSGAQWAVCLILGVISFPVAIIIRMIPDECIQKLMPTFTPRKRGPELIVSDEDRRLEWNPALEEIRDQLKIFKSLRGGRLRNLKHKLQHPQEFLPRPRSGSRSRENSVPGTPVGDSSDGSPPFPATPDSRSRKRARSRSNSAFGPAAAMAGVVAGSIAGWSPIERPGEGGDGLKFDFNGGGLSKRQGIEIHP